MKKIFLLVIPVVMTVFLTSCLRIESKSDYYKTEEVKSDKKVYFSIDCSNILDHMDLLDKGLKKYIPEYGLVIPDGEYPFITGETVYDVLLRITKENKIQMESKGFFGGREIEGINYIYNSSCGRGSRWIYKVNGEIQQPVCSEYKLQDGDIIQWVYLCNNED